MTNTPETRAKDAERKRRLYRLKQGLPEDAVLVMTPEQRRAKDIERKRLARRRKRGLPDDYVFVSKTTEERRAQQREWLRKKHGHVPKEEYLAKLAAARAEKERAKEASKLSRIRERAIAAARRAEERERQCQTSMKSGNGTMRNRGSNSPGVTRKPGRILAMAGWHGW